MDADDKMPHWTGSSRALRTRWRTFVALAVAIVVLAVAVGETVAAFRRSSDHLAAVRRDTTASRGRVATLTDQLAKATDERDRSRRAAAVARAALEQAQTAHQQSAEQLAAERSDLNIARKKAYLGLVGLNNLSAQLTALHSCLDGISRALNLIAVGEVDFWQQQLKSVDPVCQEAEAVIS